MSRYLISDDPVTQVRQYAHVHAHCPNEIVFETESRVEPCLAEAAMYRELAERVPLRNRMGRMVAVVPIDVWVQAQREKWDQKRWRQWKNDPANRGLLVERREGVTRGKAASR